MPCYATIIIFRKSYNYRINTIQRDRARRYNNKTLTKRTQANVNQRENNYSIPGRKCEDDV